MSEGRFLTGGTMGHVVRMTATGAFGITFIFLVDAMNLFWVSQLGAPQLVAAIGYAYAVQFFSVSVGVGLMITSTALISRSVGRGDAAQARRQAGAAMVSAFSLMAVVVTAIVSNRHGLIALAGADGETARLAARYLAITLPALMPMSLALVLSGTLRAYGYGAKAMYVTMFAGFVPLVFDPILILHFEMGLDGAALGLVLFRGTLLVLAVYFAILQMELVTKPRLRTLRNLAGPFAALALPTIATQMSTPAGNYILTMVMAQFGDAAMAAWAVVGRLTVVVFGGLFALSGAIGGIFGQNFGAGLMDRVRSTYRHALIFCLIYTSVAWALMLASTGIVIDAFALDATGAEVLWAFSTVGVGGFVFFGALFVSNSAFNNLGKPARSAAMNWTKDGLFSWPAATGLAVVFGAPGVIYGQAAVAAVVGTIAALWGWRFVSQLQSEKTAPLDAAA